MNSFMFPSTAEVVADLNGRLVVAAAGTRDIVASATLLLVVNDGEVSLSAFRAVVKDVAASRGVGDESLRKYFHAGALAFRQWGVALRSRIEKTMHDTNDHSVAAVCAIARDYLFDSAALGTRGKYRTVDHLRKMLAPPRAEVSAEDMATRAVKAFMKAMDSADCAFQVGELNRVADALRAKVQDIAEAQEVSDEDAPDAAAFMKAG